jgi:hypothetical protein
MLPDFPKEKALIVKFWNEYFVHKHQELLGFFATIPSFTVHEGDRWNIERTDGTHSEQLYEEISSGFTISFDEVPNLTFEKIKEKLDVVAEDAARQMTYTIIREIQDAVDKVGNTVNAMGQSITKEHFFEMLEKMDAEFDENDKWLPPSMIMSPDAWKANEEKFKDWEKDKEFTSRQSEIINKKREEWHAREALRKLVN